MKNKIILGFLIMFVFTASSVFSENTSPTDINGQAVEVSIGSIGGEMDKRAYRKLRKLLGEGVAKNVIDKFVVYSYGIEGGFSGCVEAPPVSTVPNPLFDKFVSKLSNINPKEGTVFAFNRTKSCPDLVAATNQSSLSPKLLAPITGWVGGKVSQSTVKWYAYEYLNNGVVTSGFACKCTNAPQWKGSENTSCYNTDAIADKAYSLNNPAVPIPSNLRPPPPNTPVSAGACCRAKPRATGLTLTVPAEANCYN